MENTKLVLLLRTFSKKELKQFEKFIISPIYNTGGVYVTRFFNEIKKYYPDFNDEHFTKENIYKNLYPNSKYNDITFRKLSSELIKLCEEFLIYNRFNLDEFTKNILLLEELSSRKINKLFEIKSKESFKILEKDKLKDFEYYYNKFKLISLTKLFYFNRDREKSIDFFNSEAENFINYFSLFMIHKYIERLKEKRNYTDTDFKLPFFNEVTKYIKENNLDSRGAFKIFIAELKLYLSEEEEDYFKLKELKNKYFKIIPQVDLHDIYTTLVNYATEKYEKGKDKFLREIFELYKESLKKNIIGGYFSEFQFINIITLCLRLNEVRFAERFLMKYQVSLNPGICENVVNYCYANISFAKKDYENTLNYLLKINFKQSQQKFLIKNLTLKTYYEQNRIDAIYLLIDSYKHMLKREKLVPRSIKDLINNFINFVKELTELKAGKGFKEEILRRVERTVTAEKLWLIEKLK